MKKFMVTAPELGMIGATRAALGAGIALLLADRLPGEQRRAVGWTLVALGVFSTVPLVAEVISKRVPEAEAPRAKRREAEVIY